MENRVVEREILALEAERRSAMLRGDADRLASLLDEEAIYYPGAGGRQSAKVTCESMRSGMVRYLEIGVEDEDVAVFPGFAVVTGLLLMRVMVAGENIFNRRRFADIWIKRSDGWRLAVYYGVMVESDASEIQAEIEAGVRRALAARA
jgi:ketosteroid isomerase-like protein